VALLVPVLELVFPARCFGCGAPPDALCRPCLARAGPAVAAPPPPGLDWWLAAFTYEGAVREALARVKYRNTRAALPVLAGALADRLREHGPLVDMVTWPPTTAARHRQRGFDQAEHLARAVGCRLGVPVRPCLGRRAGSPQTGRSAAERRRALAFDPAPGCRSVPGLRVLVVDDVATTGATLVSAAATLRGAGAAGVAAATVARTPRRVGLKPPGEASSSGADRSGDTQDGAAASRYQN